MKLLLRQRRPRPAPASADDYMTLKHTQPGTTAVASEQASPRGGGLMLSAWPLPYRSGLLSLALRAAEGTSVMPGAWIELIDVSGRSVKRFHLIGSHVDGHLVLTWTGAGDAGTPVPSGVYFLRAAAGGHLGSLRLAVIR